MLHRYLLPSSLSTCLVVNCLRRGSLQKATTIAAPATTTAGSNDICRRAFRALVAQSKKDAESKNEPSSQVVEFDSIEDLPRQDPNGNVEVKIHYSNLNYKDAMIVLGQKGVVQGYPIVGGIDYAGVVTKIDNKEDVMWNVGDEVVLTGNKAGQYFDGGYSQLAKVKAEWLVSPPPSLNLEECMIVGTAGVTAAQCIMHLEKYGPIEPSHGPVLVTGAGGGVGQLSIAMLQECGYEVIASTGRREQLGNHLLELGASEVIERLDVENIKPLDKQLYAGVIDTVGGLTLCKALSQTMYRGAIACPGVAGGGNMSEATVYPFILRGIRLLGIDQTMPWDVDGYPEDPKRWKLWRQERIEIWNFLNDKLNKDKLHRLVHSNNTIRLSDLMEYSKRILKGQIAGRTLVDVNK